MSERFVTIRLGDSLTVSIIMRHVADVFDVDRLELLKFSRKRQIVEARRVMFYILFWELNWSYKRMAKILNHPIRTMNTGSWEIFGQTNKLNVDIYNQILRMKLLAVIKRLNIVEVGDV